MSYRAGFVGLIGLPNAGKSSLMNVFVDEKVSIVSAKPQTTRRRVMGLLPRENGQIVFVDSPGIIKAEKGLNSFLAKEAQSVIDDSDVLLVVLNIDEEKKSSLEEVLKTVKNSRLPKIFLIHKVDLGEIERRIGKIREMIIADFPEAKVFEFSSSANWSQNQTQLKNQIIECLLNLLPLSSAPLYDIDLFTPHTTRELVCEIVREKCFEKIHQEIPYGIAVQVQKFDESIPELPKIYLNILVQKPSHKGIVIGKGGENLKMIGTEARKKVEKLLGHKVFLGLNVVVKENWSENKNLMKELGYVTDEE